MHGILLPATLAPESPCDLVWNSWQLPKNKKALFAFYFGVFWDASCCEQAVFEDCVPSHCSYQFTKACSPNWEQKFDIFSNLNKHV